MNRDQSISKVDESSSESNSVLGRGEGFSSVFEDGSSSSHSHVNNLQEQQRLMMLRFQGMHPPPAFNQHVNHMNNLEEHQRLMMLRFQGMHPPPAFNQHVNHMNNLEEHQRLMMLRFQGMHPPPAFNQHVNHMNNLEEHQRLMMLRSQGMHPPPAFNQHVNQMNNLEEQQRRRLHYHRIMQRIRHTLHTDPSSSSISNTEKARVYPPGSRFLPTDLGCVRVHLRNRVEKNKSGFITTLDLYEDDPWLLDHVQNDLFLRGEWYYFTPRNKRGASSCNRTVRGRGGGTWRSTTKKEPIMDKDEKVQGYKQSLVYNKTNVDGKIEPTGWNMTEYCLYQENQDDVVLCRIKGTLEKKGFVEEVKNNILYSNQVQDHEEEAGANGVEMRRTLQENHQQQQKIEQDTPSVVSVPPPHDGQGLGVETQNNDNNLMPMLQEDQGDATQQQQQQPQEPDEPIEFIHPRGCQDSEYRMRMQNNFMKMLQINPGDATQQQQEQEQDAPVLVPLPSHEGQDSGNETMMNNDFMMTMPLQEEDHGDFTQQQQQELYAPPVLVPPAPHEDQDSLLEEMMNDENIFMPSWDEDQQYQWDDSDLYFDVNELLDGIKEDDINEGHLQQQQPVSQARHAVGGSADQVMFTSY